MIGWLVGDSGREERVAYAHISHMISVVHCQKEFSQPNHQAMAIAAGIPMSITTQPQHPPSSSSSGDSLTSASSWRTL